MQGNGIDRRARLLEVGLTMLCSMAASAGAVLWANSSRLVEFDQKIITNSGRLLSLESRDLSQIVQISAQDQANKEILRRLERIEDKLDGR